MASQLSTVPCSWASQRLSESGRHRVLASTLPAFHPSADLASLPAFLMSGNRSNPKRGLHAPSHARVAGGPRMIKRSVQDAKRPTRPIQTCKVHMHSSPRPDVGPCNHGDDANVSHKPTNQPRNSALHCTAQRLPSCKPGHRLCPKVGPSPPIRQGAQQVPLLPQSLLQHRSKTCVQWLRNRPSTSAPPSLPGPQAARTWRPVIQCRVLRIAPPRCRS